MYYYDIVCVGTALKGEEREGLEIVEKFLGLYLAGELCLNNIFNYLSNMFFVYFWSGKASSSLLGICL